MDKKCFRARVLFTKELIYLFLLKLRQVNHEKKIAKEKLHYKLCTYKVEQVQRRASWWILRSSRGEMSYKERLTMLDLIPLSLDRELKDLVFFINAFIVVLI